MCLCFSDFFGFFYFFFLGRAEESGERGRRPLEKGERKGVTAIRKGERERGEKRDSELSDEIGGWFVMLWSLCLRDGWVSKAMNLNQ